MNYKIDKSRNDCDVLLIDGILIHSKFDPEKEASKMQYEGKNIIAVFGIGLGYHIKNIAENNPESILIVYDPLEDIRDLFFGGYYDEAVLKDKAVYFLDKMDEEKIYEILDVSGCISSGRFYFYSNPGYKRLYPEIESQFFESVKKNIEILTQNMMTESAFFHMWTRNFIYNSKNFDRYPLIDFVKTDLSENIAVIVCAGPGLDNELDSIKRSREKITIFAVDTAIKPLLKSGIKPDIAVSLDGQIHSLDDFVRDDDENTCYIFDVVSYPPAAGLVKNKFFTMTGNIYPDSLMEIFCRFYGINAGKIGSGGTVADYTLDICRRLGFKKIYFSGLDLSFPDHRTHCKNSPFYDRTLFKSSYFDTMETINAETIAARKVKSSTGKFGSDRVMTDFVLENYGAYIDRYQAAYPELKIYNSCQKGLKINNIANVPLDELVGKTASKRIPGKELMSSCLKKNIDEKKISEFHEMMKNSFYETSRILKEMIGREEFDIGKNEKILGKIYETFPILKRIIRFSGVSLRKKNQDAEINLRETGFIILQSSYFMIRTLQKAIEKKAYL